MRLPSGTTNKHSGRFLHEKNILFPFDITLYHRNICLQQSGTFIRSCNQHAKNHSAGGKNLV